METMTGSVYSDTLNIKEKSSQSGMYWVNYNNKMVIALIEDEITLRLISNSSKFKQDSTWKQLEAQSKWITKKVMVDEVTFFNIK